MIVSGIDDYGKERKASTNVRGHLRVQQTGIHRLLEELLLEMRAARIGLELLNDLEPGALIDLATETED